MSSDYLNFKNDKYLIYKDINLERILSLYLVNLKRINFLVY